MGEEFEEAEVIFVEVEVRSKRDNRYDVDIRQGNELKRKRKKRRKSSLPINIPENKSSLYEYEESIDDSDLFEDDDEGEERKVPPHVIWDRRIVENVAYSLYTGRGTTLKIRDFILRMRGFLEK
ncbi:hypothetical protein L2E82_32882 [Cichorium intybus]|uniref:Uncharacterized protein n=1 Tax=Cichorium intybus TaxID=13427 RepID=A0ACB9BIX6_CICIN|nr:hypothetical protein L2E82_32882 [Cichorium intybus]